MINVELPCRIEERISAKTNKPYMVAIVTVTEDYEMELFINNEQQAVIRMAYKMAKNSSK